MAVASLSSSCDPDGQGTWKGSFILLALPVTEQSGPKIWSLQRRSSLLGVPDLLTLQQDVIYIAHA